MSDIIKIWEEIAVCYLKLTVLSSFPVLYAGDEYMLYMIC